VTRAVVGVAAVLALAWLAVMERDVRLEARGAAALRSKADPAVLARAETDLRRANLLNPGTDADLNRALVRRARGRTQQSVALLEDLLRREPDNVLAWRVLALLSPGTARRSLAAQRRLDPLDARRR
jgi:predicted Zn-dependent protease